MRGALCDPFFMNRHESQCAIRVALTDREVPIQSQILLARKRDTSQATNHTSESRQSSNTTLALADEKSTSFERLR